MPFFAVSLTVAMFAAWSIGLGLYGVRYVRGGRAAARAGTPFRFSGVDGRGMIGKQVSAATAVVIGVALLAFALGSFAAGIALGALMYTSPPGLSRRAQHTAQSMWLDAARERPEAFVILDDVADMGHPDPHLVRTDWEEGLLDAHVEEALLRLGVG